jgi:hypothetical protein
MLQQLSAGLVPMLSPRHGMVGGLGDGLAMPSPRRVPMGDAMPIGLGMAGLACGGVRSPVAGLHSMGGLLASPVLDVGGRAGECVATNACACSPSVQ